MATRLLDLVLVLPALLILWPLLLLLGLGVKLTSPGPALFIQERVGRGGVTFRLLKFRSMRVAAPGSGALVTGRDDPRITALGRFLRRTKLDELPQLWNVVRGDMSLVGPRPEVPRYVASYSERQRSVLAVRPGITDPATLAFRDEEDLLAAVPLEQREAYYLQEILPRKLEANREYLERRTVWSDLGILWKTVTALLRSSSRTPSKAENS
jgi:lipopolysaccharide/colanic/teichoic acid biosynthesis glycosyltransferase